MMSDLSREIAAWTSGPLPIELEQEALKLFALEHPMHLWSQILSSTRHDYRHRIAVLSLRLLAAEAWTIDNVVDRLTASSLRLLYGDRVVGPTLEKAVRDYAESYLEDLSKLFGDRNCYPKDVAVNVAERAAVEVFVEECDLECGDRFFKGARCCRHGRIVTQAMSAVTGEGRY